MPYYGAGDYYRGDYYRGDNYAAGGLFGFLGKAVKKVAQTVVGATPVGRVITAIGGSAPPQITGFAPPAVIPKPGVRGTLERLVPGGESGYMPGAGYHWSESAGKWVKNRHMHVTNTVALRRAGRRVKGFLRVASRLGALPVNRGKGKLFKRKRRAA